MVTCLPACLKKLCLMFRNHFGERKEEEEEKKEVLLLSKTLNWKKWQQAWSVFNQKKEKEMLFLGSLKLFPSFEVCGACREGSHQCWRVMHLLCWFPSWFRITYQTVWVHVSVWLWRCFQRDSTQGEVCKHHLMDWRPIQSKSSNTRQPEELQHYIWQCQEVLFSDTSFSL